MGDNYALMHDTTWSYDYSEAMRVGRALEELGFLWYEYPLAEESMHDYANLRGKLGIPIMSTAFVPGASMAHRRGSRPAPPISYAATW